MVVWLIKEGEKIGPFEDYEVREMIREGEIDAETKAWHEGAEGWMAAPEVPVLKSEFEKKVPVPPSIPVQMPPFLAWRRLGARFFDYTLYSSMVSGILLLTGSKLQRVQELSVWSVVGIVLPVVLMEAAMVHSVGFTPGKWLLGLRVETVRRERLRLGQALIRTMRVWILGMGMGINPILMFLGHCLSLWFGLKKGGLIWDLQSGFQVANLSLNPKRIVIYWILMAVIFVANVAMVWPEFSLIVEEEMRRQGK